MGSAVATAVSNYSKKKKERGTEELGTDKDSAANLLRQDLTRSLRATKAGDKVSFLTEIIKQLWDYLNVAGGDTIRATLEPMLSEMTPAIFVTKMDLGKVPIELNNIVVHQIQKEAGVLQFDMDMVWDGECDIQVCIDLNRSRIFTSTALARSNTSSHNVTFSSRPITLAALASRPLNSRAACPSCSNP